MLGDVVTDDTSYTGETGDTPFSLQYYRNWIGDFQVKLQALDASAQAIRDLIAVSILGPGDESYDQLVEWIDDYDARRDQVVSAAQAINVAAEGANAIGIRMPVVSVPSGLLGNPVVIAAVAAAVAAGAWAVSYAVTKRAEAQARIETYRANIEAITGLPDDQRAAALASANEAQVRIAGASGPAGILAGAADMIKWAAIAAMVWFGYKAWSER